MIADIIMVEVVIAVSRNRRKINRDAINKIIDDIVAIIGPLLNVNNCADNCTDNIIDHSKTVIMNFFFSPWFMAKVYRWADENPIVMRIGISSSEPAKTALPVVSVAREKLSSACN